MIVSYVKPSDDAAIAGTYKDLKFKNNLDNPVYIEGYCSGGVITFNVYGVETRPANREISFRSETLSEEDPVTQFKVDAGQPVGYFNTEQSAHKGLTARLWKTVTVDGAVQSDEVFNNSKYKSSPKIVTVGTAGASAEVVAQLQAAAVAFERIDRQALDHLDLAVPVLELRELHHLHEVLLHVDHQIEAVADQNAVGFGVRRDRRRVLRRGRHAGQQEERC